MSTQTAPRNTLLPWIAGAGVLAAAFLIVKLVREPEALSALPLFDFVEYWAAGRLTLQGDNPYDLARMRELERSVGGHEDGLLMWNPPWTLPLVMPLGALPCRVAHILWLLVQLAALGWSADRLWRAYSGDPDKRWVAWAVAVTFLPGFLALTAGQISPLVLLGVVLFLVFIERGQDVLAGAACVLVAIKPHLAYLFWLALFVWCVHQRRWRVLAGGAVMGLLCLVLPLVANHDILGQYLHTMTHSPPAQYRSPTLGAVLRMVLGDAFGFQFLALIPGLVWLAAYGWRHRNSWVWKERMPMLLFVSLLTAAYGAWPFDLVLLLPAVLLAAVRLSRGEKWVAALAVGAHLLVNGLAAWQLLAGWEYLAFLWMTPALLVAYCIFGRAPRPAALIPHPG